MTIDIYRLANSAIQQVNRDRPATLLTWASNAKSESGRVEKAYIETNISANDQAMAADRLSRIDGIDQSKTYRKIYIRSTAGTVSINKGYDLVRFSESEIYKIEQVLEDWTSNPSRAWCCVLGVRQ